MFKSSFAATEAGAYKVNISSVQAGRQLDSVINVAQPSLEKLGQPINAQILQEIAAMTGGVSVPAACCSAKIRGWCHASPTRSLDCGPSL